MPALRSCARATVPEKRLRDSLHRTAVLACRPGYAEGIAPLNHHSALLLTLRLGYSAERECLFGGSTGAVNGSRSHGILSTCTRQPPGCILMTLFCLELVVQTQ